ncbi:hypothetical protein [Halobacteriovorax sp. RT-1-4]|uniref:hypothetical protein n=1 Tax=unclassified Halobacteriovorax TaxID=2639665 RepID=UPI0039996DBF
MRQLLLPFFISLLIQQALVACEISIKNFSFDYIDEVSLTNDECRLINNRIIQLKQEFQLTNKAQKQNQEKYISNSETISLQIQQLRINGQVYGQVLIGKFLL